MSKSAILGLLLCLVVVCVFGCDSTCKKLHARRAKCHKHFVAEESEFVRKCEHYRDLFGPRYSNPSHECVKHRDCVEFKECWAREHIETLQFTVGFCDNFHSPTMSEQVECGSKLISDLTPLKDLKKLGHLILAGCEKITDLGPLRDLTNLKEIDLAGTSVRDLSPLKALLNLTKLDLSGTPVPESEISALKVALPQLEITKD